MVSFFVFSVGGGLACYSIAVVIKTKNGKT